MAIKKSLYTFFHAFFPGINLENGQICSTKITRRKDKLDGKTEQFLWSIDQWGCGLTITKVYRAHMIWIRCPYN